MIDIFELVSDFKIDEEYDKVIQELATPRYICGGRDYSFFNYLDIKGIFRRWKYRGTKLNTYEYLLSIGIYDDKLSIEVKFLRYIQFVLNMEEEFEYNYGRGSSIVYFDSIIENINICLDKLGYVAKKDNDCDKVILYRKDADLDSILENVDDNLQNLLIRYKDFSIEKSIYDKASILKKIDLDIEKYKKLYQGKDKITYNTIGNLVNNYGINHPSNKIEGFNDEKIIEIYNDCFILMIHLIRSVEYEKIKEKYKEESER